MVGTAVVVGAGQGMGRAVALRLAREGYALHLVGRSGHKLVAVAEEIAAAGGSATLTEADVTLPGDLERVVASVEHGVDVVVNTVGESLMSSFEETTLEQWNRCLAINLTSVFLTAQAFLPLLRCSSNPSLVLLSSKTALKGYPVVGYSAAKAGVLGFARALAAELAPEHIRVAALCPGPTDTPMRWSATPDMDPQQVIDVTAVSEAVAYVVNLPRGATVGPILVEADLYD